MVSEYEKETEKKGGKYRERERERDRVVAIQKLCTRYMVDANDGFNLKKTTKADCRFQKNTQFGPLILPVKVYQARACMCVYSGGFYSKTHTTYLVGVCLAKCHRVWLKT